MIRVSRLDGKEFVLNAELIETIETSPDTHITLTDGKHLIVCEALDEVVERVMAYRRRVYGLRLGVGLADAVTPES